MTGLLQACRLRVATCLRLRAVRDSVGDAQYNYKLSQRRADAVVDYLSAKYNVPPHKFYLVGIGKDSQIASDKTASGRAKNRRVEVKLMSNMTNGAATTAARIPRIPTKRLAVDKRFTTEPEDRQSLLEGASSFRRLCLFVLCGKSVRLE